MDKNKKHNPKVDFMIPASFPTLNDTRRRKKSILHPPASIMGKTRYDGSKRRSGKTKANVNSVRKSKS